MSTRQNLRVILLVLIVSILTVSCSKKSVTAPDPTPIKLKVSGCGSNISFRVEGCNDTEIIILSRNGFGLPVRVKISGCGQTREVKLTYHSNTCVKSIEYLD